MTLYVVSLNLNLPNSRNRRLLLAALRAECRILLSNGQTCLIGSATKPGVTYRVETDVMHGNATGYKCSCRWGTEQGWVAPAYGDLPCCHVLLLEWQLMTDAEREAFMRTDPELRTAAGAYDKAVAA